LPSEWEP